jgi:D-alanyl-D-alanine carboxypeptidase-like protein
MRTSTKSMRVAFVTVVAVGVVTMLPSAGFAISPIQPANRPTPLPGATNGLVPRSMLIDVAPNCVAAREAGPSLARLFAMAREQNFPLGAEECYRPLAGQIDARNSATAAGNAACAASVNTSATGQPVGTSMHGWGKAVDFSYAGHGVGFSSPAYFFLKANAARVGWNHPGWAEPGGSSCPEAWHWEWVGDGGNLHLDPLRGDVVGLIPSATDHGYAVVTGLGALAAHGDAVVRGSAASLPLVALVVGAVPTRTRAGYWMVAADGGVFSYGDARFHGSTGGTHLNAPVLGMAPTATSRGYWLFAWDGGVFSFGDARFHGSTGAMRLARPVVGMAASSSGNGYWLVAADGGIFSFGDARFRGSLGGHWLVAPIVGMAPTASGNGYWLVGEDGGVFAFGDAHFYGSAAGGSSSPTVGIVATKTGRGYRIVRANGDVVAFGDAGWYGNG